MMKCLIFVCLLVVCLADTEPPPSSSIQSDRQIYFHENGSVSLHGINGNQFTISHYPEQHYYDIVIHGFGITPKHIHVDSENCQITHLEGFQPVHQQYKEKTVDQSKTHLFEILKKFEGKVSDEEFKELLEKIEKAVEQGKICHLVYHLLTKLDETIKEDLIQEYVKQYHYQPEEKPSVYNKDEQQKLYNLLIEYILKSKYELAYPKYGYEQYPYQYQSYPSQYQPYSYQNQQYSYQYPEYLYQQQQQQQQQPQYQQYPYQYQQYQQYPSNQYQQQYPQYQQYYPQQYQPYTGGYYGGEKSNLKNYVSDTTYQNALQTTTTPQQKGYGYGYGFGQNQPYGLAY